jgi:hypothetical protein
VGPDAADAAWLVLQHSVGDPAVMRRGLALAQAAPAEDVDPAQVAMLEDRVRVHSGLPQRYATQFDWDADGVLSPYPTEDQEGVEARRRAVGLPPLAESSARCARARRGRANARRATRRRGAAPSTSGRAPSAGTSRTRRVRRCRANLQGYRRADGRFNDPHVVASGRVR